MTAQPYTPLDFAHMREGTFPIHMGERDRWLATVAERDERIKELEHFLSTARGAANELWSRAESAEARVKELESAHSRTLDVLAALVNAACDADEYVAIMAASAHLKECGR